MSNILFIKDNEVELTACNLRVYRKRPRRLETHQGRSSLPRYIAMNEIHPIFILLIFIAGWIVASCLISFLGGWFWLAKKFPLHNDVGNVIKNFMWRSLNLNYLCGYGSCVNIKITDNGLLLKTSLLFSVFHRPIFL